MRMPKRHLMRRLLDDLLTESDQPASALDLAPEVLAAVVPPVRAGGREQRLSPFDVADERAEQRAHARRRVIGAAVIAAGSAAAVAGSLALVL